MRILLDECVPEPFRRYLWGHDVTTARHSGLSGRGDGIVLAEAVARGYEVLLTVDANLPYQQNVSAHRIVVVVMRVWRNNLDRLIPLIPELNEVLRTAKPGRVYRIE